MNDLNEAGVGNGAILNLADKSHSLLVDLEAHISLIQRRLGGIENALKMLLRDGGHSYVRHYLVVHMKNGNGEEDAVHLGTFHLVSGFEMDRIAVHVMHVVRERVAEWMDNPESLEWKIGTKHGFVDTETQMERHKDNINYMVDMLRYRVKHPHDSHGPSSDRPRSRLEIYRDAGVQLTSKEMEVLLHQDGA